MKLNLIEELEARSGGIKVSDLAAILGVDDKHIYRMKTLGKGKQSDDASEKGEGNVQILVYPAGTEIPPAKPNPGGAPAK